MLIKQMTEASEFALVELSRKKLKLPVNRRGILTPYRRPIFTPL
jgi:hypothetical protein